MILIACIVLFIQNILHLDVNASTVSKLYIIYLFGFIVEGVAIVGMFVFRNNADIFFWFILIYSCSFFIKLIGRMIDAKITNKVAIYNKDLKAIKIIMLYIAITFILIIIGSLLLYILDN